MRSIVVVGAGGLAAELADVVIAMAAEGGWALRGFLDDDPGTKGWLPAPVLGPVDAAALSEEDEVVLGVGDPRTRWHLARRLERARWATVVHPSAIVSPSARLGAGCFIAPFAYVGARAVVGAHSVLNVYAGVGHDAGAGAFSVLSPYATLNGHATLGEGTFLGTAAVMGVGRIAGAWAKVAAGAVVNRDVPAGSLAAGNPARSRVLFRPPTPDERAVSE